MGYLKFVDQAIDQRLKDLHTAYLAKILSANEKTAKIQPLGLIKEYGGTEKKQAVVSNVPITANVTNFRQLVAGDIVVCIVCDRDISEARKGNNRLPPVGHHSLSDSVIIGVL